MVTRVLLGVDLSYQSYRAAAAHGKLTSSTGEFTGGLYGFLVTLAKTINDTQATHVVVCEDRKPYRRSLLYPEYKQLRKATADEELKERADVTKLQVMKALDVIGIPVVGVNGFESDDIIGHYVTRHRHRFETIYAASNDSDLFQLLIHRRFRVYRKDETDVVSYDSLKRSTGLEPEEFMLASALMGTHNDVAGIPKVGEKTAIKAVKTPSALRMYREQWADLIERNLRLIRLPYEGFPAHLELPTCGSFVGRDFIRHLARYDINVTTSMMNAFERVCP